MPALFSSSQPKTEFSIYSGNARKIDEERMQCCHAWSDVQPPSILLLGRVFNQVLQSSPSFSACRCVCVPLGFGTPSCMSSQPTQKGSLKAET